MAGVYRVPLTGAQLRVLHENLSLLQNDPDWQEAASMTDQDKATFDRAQETITDWWRRACRHESTPAG